MRQRQAHSDPNKRYSDNLEGGQHSWSAVWLVSNTDAARYSSGTPSTISDTFSSGRTTCVSVMQWASMVLVITQHFHALFKESYCFVSLHRRHEIIQVESELSDVATLYQHLKSATSTETSFLGEVLIGTGEHPNLTPFNRIVNPGEEMNFSSIVSITPVRVTCPRTHGCTPGALCGGAGDRCIAQ